MCTTKGFYSLLVAGMLSLVLLAGCGGGGGGNTSNEVSTNIITGAVPPPDSFPESADMNYTTDEGETINVQAISGQIIVQFSTTLSEERAENLILSKDGVITSKIPSLRFYLVTVQSRNEMSFINSMRDESGVIYAEPNTPLAAQSSPNEWDNNNFKDATSWYLDNINAPAAWDIILGSPSLQEPLKSTTIGIIDGFQDLDKGTADFSGRILNEIPTTYIHNTNHGTMVAALSCSEGNNSFGNIGVNWWSKLRLYSWQGNSFTALYRIVTAVNDGAKVINISLGSGNNDGICQPEEISIAKKIGEKELFLLLDALNVVNSNYIIVQAAGNDNCNRSTSLVKPNNLMVVGATTKDNLKAWYSNDGSLVDIAAPGGDQAKGIGWFDYGTDAISSAIGTSFSAPLVAGAAALVWAQDTSLTPQQVIQQLKSTANGSISEFGGVGILDVCKALGGCLSDTTAPSDPTNLIATPASASQINLSWTASTDNVGVAGYKIYREGTYLKSVNTASTSDTGLSPATQYCYTVSAYDAAGNVSLQSSSACATTQDTGSTPSAPTSVTATAGNGQVAISWNAVSGATSYNIYWSTTSGVSKTSYTGKISNVTSPYTHTGRSNGTTYYYVVTAENSYGESAESSQASATPQAAPAATGRMPDTNQTTSYTNTFGEDHDYTINPPSYTDNGDGTVTDNVTGLVWQKQDDATTRTWADAGTYCDASTLGGYSDWRLPSQIELISIIDNGVYNPSINTTFFPGTSSSYYWSSTTIAYPTSPAWGVYFSSGYSNGGDKSNSGYARCVRGGQATPSLSDNGNGTVPDSGTLLTWQQSENSAMTWEAALSYCEGLSLAGSTDWRLPNHKELLSLVDDTRYNPTINTTIFPGAVSSNYWSSTTNAGYTSTAWSVYFGNGYSSYYGKTNSFYVRCVRGGQ